VPLAVDTRARVSRIKELLAAALAASCGWEIAAGQLRLFLPGGAEVKDLSLSLAQVPPPASAACACVLSRVFCRAWPRGMATARDCARRGACVEARARAHKRPRALFP